MKLIWINFLSVLSSAASIQPVPFHVQPISVSVLAAPQTFSAVGKMSGPRLSDLPVLPHAIGAASTPPVQASADVNGPGVPDDPAAAREKQPLSAAYQYKLPRKKQALRYLHEERPNLDYRNNAFDAETARRFAEEVRRFEGDRSFTGRELLRLVLTDFAARPDLPLDLRLIDPSLFGRSDGALREKLPAFDLAPREYDDFLKAAFHLGLIYRINDSRRGQTFYGIPGHVRAALRLDPAFRSTLLQLIEEVGAGPENDELYEYTALAAEAAVRAGRLDASEMPPDFEKRIVRFHLEVPPLASALLTLLEASHGTALFPLIDSLCAAAVDDGILEAEALESLRKEWPTAAPAEMAAESVRFGADLRSLTLNPAKQQKDAPELFKLLAQTIAAAARDNLLDPAQLPPEFAARAQALELEELPLQPALAALLEASRGTLWEETIADLYARAAAEGIASTDPRENRR